MHMVVIGAGIIGVTTAYFLRRDGHDVTVIERRSGVAQETSFANAGVMAPSYVAPVVAARYAGQGPCAICSRPKPRLYFGPSLDPALWRWIARWLGECRLERFTRNKARMQRLAFYSQSELRALRELHQLDYEQTIGYLQLFRTRRGGRTFGGDAQDVDRAGRRTPPSQHRQKPMHSNPHCMHRPALAGALHLPNDETGNCAFFAQQLKDIAIGDGVDFRFGVVAQSLRVEQQRVTGLRTDTGETFKLTRLSLPEELTAVALLRPLGIRLADAAGQGLLRNRGDHCVRACAVYQRDG